MLHSVSNIDDISKYSPVAKSLRSISAKLLVLFLQYWLLIDMANGFLIKNGIYLPGGFSLGELSRITFLILFLLSFQFNKNSLNHSLIILPLLLLLFSIFQVLFFSTNVIATINISIKLCLPILIFLYIKECLSNNREVLIKIVKTNSVILVLNLIMSLFGFGFFTYEITGGIGYGGKGFFFAGNEVSIVILVTYSLLAYLYKNNLKTISIITLVYVFISLVSLTRASIFGVILVYTAMIILYHKKHRLKILVISSSMIVVIIYVLRDYIMLAVNRAIYFIDNTSMLIFMTGGHKRWEATQDYFESIMISPLLLLTGRGWTGYSEQDIIDLVSAFGIVGISIYLIWFYISAYTIRNHNRISDKIYLIIVFLIIFGIATLAGHVMTSAMLAPFIAILGNIHLLRANNKSLKIKIQDA